MKWGQQSTGIAWPGGWGETGQNKQDGLGASPQKASPVMARSLRAESADVAITTGTTDPILITLTRLRCWPLGLQCQPCCQMKLPSRERPALQQVRVITLDSHPMCRAQLKPDLL